MDMIHVQASITSLPFQNSGHEAARRSANYHPSIWGDHFLAYDSNLTEIDSREKEEHEQLKQNLMKMLHGAPNKSLQKLELIDAMQRLGVSYHFESEIKQSLECIYNGYQECFEEDGNDLYIVALRFRLLRQQGHRVPCDVFNKFKDLDGKFDASLSNTRGILSLYEAAHFRVHGEDILDDALAFTTSHLEAIKPKLMSNLLAAQVNHALRLPIHTAMTRLAAKQYISIYQEDQSSLNCLLLKFAKLDFNILQKMHQRELSGITRWWKSLDFATNLSFARDRLVECYFWILGVYFEPQYCLARRILTKVIALASAMDDIYDVYGTLDELTLLTDAIERWDITAADQLPWYMQIFYRALLNVYAELEEELVKERKLYCVKFAKAAMKNLARSYFQEAKWFHNGYVPTYEEYMKNALVSGGYMMLVANAFASMGTIVTPEGFDWFLDEPLIMKASSVICRLTDDIMTHQIEQQRGDVSSAVECYMRQYGATKEEAFSQFQKQIANAWKDINEECLHPIGVPMPLLMVILNLTRMINLIYKDDDGFTNSKTKLRNYVSSVLVDSA